MAQAFTGFTDGQGFHGSNLLLCYVSRIVHLCHKRCHASLRIRVAGSKSTNLRGAPLAGAVNIAVGCCAASLLSANFHGNPSLPLMLTICSANRALIAANDSPSVIIHSTCQ